jgi:competence protein ComEA
MPSFTVSRRHAVAVVVAVLAAIFLAGHLLTGKPGAGAGTVEGSGAAAARGPTVAPSPAATAARYVVVDVAGEVRRPGVYRLRQGARITDAVVRAGGATNRAQLALVDLAAPLADGEQVLVPGRVAASAGGDGGGADAGAGTRAAAGGSSPTAPVDLNTATAEQLDALPGIGPVTAQKIIDYRQAHGPYTSVDQLDAIPGIGAARIENLRGLVVP